MSPTVGQIVLYKLNQGDADAIATRRREHAKSGLACEFGNEARRGQEYPAVVVCVFSPSEAGTANLHVLLDGHDSYWATSRYNARSGAVAVRQALAGFVDGEGCYRLVEAQS